MVSRWMLVTSEKFTNVFIVASTQNVTVAHWFLSQALLFFISLSPSLFVTHVPGIISRAVQGSSDVVQGVIEQCVHIFFTSA